MRTGALPARYKGVLYRSRLEARWAVFFDHLGVKAEYEPQGFTTDGTNYLPDFVIFAALGTVWAEVKPSWRADPDGVARWRRFADHRPQPSRAVLLTGLPAIGNTAFVVGGDINADEPGKGPWDDDTQEWRPCPGGYHFDLAYPGTFRAKFAEDGCDQHFGGDGEQKLADAAAAACSARFGQ